MPFGILDTQYIDLPANVDAAYIQGLQTRAGLNFADILREIDSRLQAFNNTVEPVIASLLAPPSPDMEVDDSAPVAFTVTERGEYTLARPQYADGAAHMIPLRNFDVALGFTEDGLESMSMRGITRQVDSMLLGLRLRQRRDALIRLFSDAEVRVSPRTTATSPGFAGSGTGLNVFTGPYPNGTALPGGYTHYARAASADLSAAIKTGRNTLRKWFSGPFDLATNQTEIDAIKALPEFVSAGSELVRVGTGTAEATVDAATYIGVFDGDVRVRQPIDDFTEANIAIYKTFGNFAEGNALQWRYDAMKGRNAYVRSRELYPLDQSNLLQSYGIGVASRVAAYLILIAASGGYVPPTIG